MDIINNRRSVRKFLDKQVEQEKVEQLLRAAMQAPTAKNVQPWRFLVIQNNETLQKLGQMSKIIAGCRLVIILMIDKELFPEPNLYAMDMGAATQNILLKGVQLDLGAVWIGLDGRLERIKGYLDILKVPEKYQLFSLLAIGYPEDEKANHYLDRFDQNKVFYEGF